MFDIATHKSTYFKSQNIVLEHFGFIPLLIYGIKIWNKKLKFY